MKVLVAFEESATVRDALRARGVNAWSCDLQATRGDPAWHIQADAVSVLYSETWNAVIAHPPCTYVALSGNRWYAGTEQRRQGIELARVFIEWADGQSCVENPMSVLSTAIRKPDQIIQPWMFGHGEVKATCLWLRDLPPLTPTDVVPGREARIWKMPPGPHRQRERSKTYAGIARAMAEQWF